MNAQRNVLYAFIQDASVLYVGKTTGSQENRMGGYCEHGDEFAFTGLQYEADDEYTRGGIAVEGHERVSALTSCYQCSDLGSFMLA